MAGGSAKAILYALGANAGIAIAKFVAWAITGSGSMLAEAIHSTADCTNQVFLFIGMRQAKRPPNKTHPLGYGKAIFVWSFVVAFLLFSVGGLFSVYEGYHKLHSHEEVGSMLVAIIVLVISIFLEAFSLAGAMKEINAIKGDKTLMEWLKTSRAAELVVVFGEDVAALMGLVVALVFVGLTAVTSNHVFDALGSMSIGVMLILISFFLIYRVQGMLVGTSAGPDIEKAISEAINEADEIVEVLNVITMQYGPDVMLAAKVKMKAKLTINEASEAINVLERRVKEAVPQVRWSFVEPDVSDE